MIFKPNSDVMRAFAALQSNQNFQVILLFLAECLDRTHEAEDKAIEEYKVRWHQGQAQDLRELLFLAEESKRL